MSAYGTLKSEESSWQDMAGTNRNKITKEMTGEESAMEDINRQHLKWFALLIIIWCGISQYPELM